MDSHHEYPALAIHPFSSSSPPTAVIGGDRDLYGCIASAGYQWCASSNKCYRSWEENCTDVTVGNDADAHNCLASAGYSYCVSTGQCYRPWETNCSTTTTIIGIFCVS